MSKSSTVTVRETPVASVSTASVGGLTVHGETFLIETDQRVELVDLTNRIMDFARRFNVREGLVSLWSMHTTCAVFINEFQTALLTDIKAFLEKMVARDEEWLHNNPDHSDCDRMNADAHLRALLLGHSLTLQISGGEVVLGQWQRILMAELDGPRARTLRIQASPRRSIPVYGSSQSAICSLQSAIDDFAFTRPSRPGGPPRSLRQARLW
jgi:secondary thiamine-phosphate synthase enzyme